MRLETVYQCSRCGAIHEHEDDAGSCCRPDVTEGYQCSECDEFHTTETDALNCCRDEDTPPIISPRDLERAGQLRMIP